MREDGQIKTGSAIALIVLAVALGVLVIVPAAKALNPPLVLAENVPANALDDATSSTRQWMAACADDADGGPPGDIYDDIDGGVHCASSTGNCGTGGGFAEVHVTNDNAGCVLVGGAGVNANNGFEIGTGAGCADGVSVGIATKGAITCMAAATPLNVRVKAGRQ